MKQTYYLIQTASDRMGGGDSYDSISETDLFKEANKWMLSSPYVTIYQKTSKSELLKKQQKIKKTPLALKMEKLEVAQEKLSRHYRAYRFAGPSREAREEREKLETEVEKLKLEIKVLNKKS